MKLSMLCAATIALTTGAAHAATYTYDFKAAADPGGAIGEAIFETFNTSDSNGVTPGPVFIGPNLSVTGSNSAGSAYVYFDKGNAGMGVCGTPNSASIVDVYFPGSGTNRCNPGYDDGLTSDDESLHFSSTEQDVLITSIFINSNHDTADVMDTVWEIGGAIYDSADFLPASGGDIRIDVNYRIDVGQTMSLRGVSGANSYISAIGVSPVPLPASLLLLVAGLGGLGAMRARKKG